MKIDEQATSEFESENVRLFIDDEVDMGAYQLGYKGKRIRAKGYPGYWEKNMFAPTEDPYLLVAREDAVSSAGAAIQKGDTIESNPENTYYEVAYVADNGKTFNLFPRIQMNDQMGGIIPSPDIKKYLGKDLYTHVNGIPDPEVPNEWTETTEVRTRLGDQFFIKDYVSYIESVTPLKNTDHANIGNFDVGIKATVKVMGKNKEYKAEPFFVIKDMNVGSLPSVIEELGIRVSVLNVHPETNEFSLGINTTSKDYIILKAIEMPLINILWSGTLLTLFGFGIAIVRRFRDFNKMKQKGVE
jgi:cytochrome c-type biogenesis protein CcmF